jgi:hypothetical protein
MRVAEGLMPLSLGLRGSSRATFDQGRDLDCVCAWLWWASCDTVQSPFGEANAASAQAVALRGGYQQVGIVGDDAVHPEVDHALHGGLVVDRVGHDLELIARFVQLRHRRAVEVRGVPSPSLLIGDVSTIRGEAQWGWTVMLGGGCEAQS